MIVHLLVGFLLGVRGVTLSGLCCLEDRRGEALMRVSYTPQSAKTDLLNKGLKLFERIRKGGE